ncbi:MAG: hypothetical protein V4736_07085 [Bdellovibrionota bacterium]
MKSFICFATLVFVSFAQADLSGVAGDWRGWGQWTFQGSGTDCFPMDISFKETDGQLSRVKGFFECSVVALHSDPLVWEKSGDKLLMDGKEVGTLKPGLVEMSEPYDDEVTVKTTMNIEGNHMDYMEIWTFNDGRPLYEITGRLFRRTGK